MTPIHSKIRMNLDERRTVRLLMNGCHRKKRLLTLFLHLSFINSIADDFLSHRIGDRKQKTLANDLWAIAIQRLTLKKQITWVAMGVLLWRGKDTPSQT